MNFKKFFESKWFVRILVGIGALIILFLVFGLGMSVGFHKARFSYAWGENYDRNFGGPQHGIFGFSGGTPFPPPSDGEFMNSHGIFGTILSVGSSTIAVNDRDGIEKTIAFSSSTLVRAGRDTLSPQNLEINDRVVIIGSPNEANGEIEARLIRVLP